MDPHGTPLTDDEKRLIVAHYQRLRLAIDGSFAEDDVAECAIAFQRAYIGESRPLVDAFGTADDKAAWARQVRARLDAELGPTDWPAAPGHTADAPDDEVTSRDADRELVRVPVTCGHCGRSFDVQCAFIPGATMVTTHEVACPSCSRLSEQALPGPAVQVVAGDA